MAPAEPLLVWTDPLREIIGFLASYLPLGAVGYYFAVLRPDPKGPYPHGLHTRSVWGDRLLVDGKCWRRRPQLLADKLLYRLRRGARS